MQAYQEEDRPEKKQKKRKKEKAEQKEVDVQPDQASDLLKDKTIAASPEEEKTIKMASELFAKFEKSRKEKVEFTGYEFAILSDLQIFNGQVSPGNPRQVDIQNEFIELRDNRPGEIKNMPKIWAKKMETVRQKRFEELADFNSISSGIECFPIYGFAAIGPLPEDPEMAGALFRVLEKLGSFNLSKATLTILRNSSAAELSIINQVLDFTPPHILSVKQDEFFEGMKETLAGAGEDVTSFKELLKVAREGKYNDPERPAFLRRIGAAALPGAGLYGVSQGIAFLAGATILPVGLGIIGALGAAAAIGILVRSNGKAHPHIRVLEETAYRESINRLKINKENTTDEPLELPEVESEGVAATSGERSNLAEGLIDAAKLYDAFTGSPLEEPLKILSGERENLERTLTLAGYSELPPTLKRSFEILDEMLLKYSEVLQSGGEPSQTASEKIISTSESMRKYITELNSRLKAAFEREISGHAMAVKSILSSLEQIEQEMSRLVN